MRESIQTAMYAYFIPGAGGRSATRDENAPDSDIVTLKDRKGYVHEVDDPSHGGNFEEDEEVAPSILSPEGREKAEAYALERQEIIDAEKEVSDERKTELEEWFDSPGVLTDENLEWIKNLPQEEKDVLMQRAGVRGSKSERDVKRKEIRATLIDDFATDEIDMSDPDQVHSEVEAWKDEQLDEINMEFENRRDAIREEEEKDSIEEVADLEGQEELFETAPSEKEAEKKIAALNKKQLNRVFALEEDARLAHEELDKLIAHGEEAITPEKVDEKLSAVEERIKNLSHWETVPKSSRTAGEQILDTVQEHGAEAIVAIENLDNIPLEEADSWGRKTSALQHVGEEIERIDKDNEIGLEKDDQGMFIESSVLGALKAFVMNDIDVDTDRTTSTEFGEGRPDRKLNTKNLPIEVKDRLLNDTSAFNVVPIENWEKKQKTRESTGTSQETFHSKVKEPELPSTPVEDSSLERRRMQTWNPEKQLAKKQAQEAHKFDKPESSERLSKAVKLYETDGAEAVREAVTVPANMNATSLNRLIDDFEWGKILDAAGAKRNKDCKFSSSKQNRNMVADLLVKTIEDADLAEYGWDEQQSDYGEDPADEVPSDPEERRTKYPEQDEELPSEYTDGSIKNPIEWTSPLRPPSYLDDEQVGQPMIEDVPELGVRIEERLRRHFGPGKLGIETNVLTELIEKDGVTYVGRAMGRLAEWVGNRARIDDIPHEYFHLYAEIFKDTPIIKHGIKKFTDTGLSEMDAIEELTEMVGNYYADRIQDKGLVANIKAFLRQMWLAVKKAFGQTSKEDMASIIAEKFFQGWLPTVKAPSGAKHDEEVAIQTVSEGLSELLKQAQEEGSRGFGTYGIHVDVELADVEKAYWDGTRLVTRADKEMDLAAAEEDASRTHLGEFEELAAKETYDSMRREWLILEDTAVKIDFLANENKVVFSMLDESFDKAYVFEQVSNAVEAVQKKLNLSSDTKIELKTNYEYETPIETIADLLGEGIVISQRAFFSTFDNTNDGYDDSLDDDGKVTEIDAIESLKKDADAFLETIFLDVFAAYIPKTKYFRIIDIANDSYDYNEFDQRLRDHMVENYAGKIAAARGMKAKSINSNNVVLAGISPTDVEGLQKRFIRYELFSKQFYQRMNSSVSIGAQTVINVGANEQGETETTVDVEVVDKLGRIVYDLYFEVFRGKAQGKPSISIVRENNIATGQANPTRYRENFLERAFREGLTDARFIYLPMKNVYKHITPKDNPDNKFWVQDDSLLQLNTKWIRNINNLNSDNYKNGIVKDLAFFFSTKAGDNKIMLLSFVPKEWKGSQQTEHKGKVVTTDMMNRDFMEKELETHVAMGWMTKQHMADLLSGADQLAEPIGKKKGGAFAQAFKHPLAYAQELSRHIRWQEVKGNNYLARQKKNGVADTVNRLRLDFSEGTVVIGSGARKIVWANHEDIEIKTQTRDGLINVPVNKNPQVGEGYSQDGYLYVAAGMMNKRGEELGVPPESRGVSKTVIRHLTDNNNSYIAVKMLEMAADNGTMFFKKGSETPFAKLKGTGNNAMFVMLDETGTEIEGSEFDSFGTRDELKDISGRYEKDFTHGIDGIHELPEEATRVLIQPYKSNKTAPHPVQVHDLLMTNSLRNIPEGAEYMDALAEHIREAGSRYIDKLLSFRSNPKALRDYLKKELAEGQLPTELDAYLELFEDGEGLLMPQVINQIAPMLTNHFIVNGAFKVRSEAGRGTKGYLKPQGANVVEPGSMIISAQNKTMVNRVAMDYRKAMGLKKGDALPWENLHTKVKVLNEWLEGREYMALVHRQPVQGATRVEPRRIQRFIEGVQGDTVRVSEHDVFVLHEADFDGDTLFIEVPKNKRLLNSMKELSKTDFWRSRAKIVRLSMFSKSDETTSLSNHNDVGEYYRKNNAARNAIAMLVNGSVLMNTMSAKGISLGANILPENDRIIAGDPFDRVKMTYLPLDPNMSKGDYDLIESNGDRVIVEATDQKGNTEWRKVPFEHLKTAVEKGGLDLVLETTRENEFSNLIQMAADNPKEQLLGSFKGIEFDYNFTSKRTFKRLKGDYFSKKLIGALRNGIANTFKNAMTRRGQRVVGRKLRKMTMEDIFEESARMRTIYFDADGEVRSPEDMQKIMTAVFTENTPTTYVNMGKERGKVAIEWSDITVNNHVSAIEHIIALPQLLLDANQNIIKESMAGSPLRYDRWMYYDAHVRAMEQLNSVMEKKINDYLSSASPEKAKEVGLGSLFMEEMAGEFQDILDKIGNNTSADIEGIKYEHSREFQDFIEKWQPRWSELSPRSQAWGTLKFLAGTSKINLLGERSKVASRLKLLPIQLMEPNIIRQYGKLFHKYLTGPIAEKQEGLTPGAARYAFKFKDFEEVAERLCG